MPESVPLSMLSICRQLHTEAKVAFYKYCTFLFSTKCALHLLVDDINLDFSRDNMEWSRYVTRITLKLDLFSQVRNQRDRLAMKLERLGDLPLPEDLKANLPRLGNFSIWSNELLPTSGKIERSAAVEGTLLDYLTGLSAALPKAKVTFNIICWAHQPSLDGNEKYEDLVRARDKLLDIERRPQLAMDAAKAKVT
ncbi:MAG: hypothetical protein MMC23_001566 [Stictis urceolatum]|nr:hypothetical protein [Stictis urceolata]